MFFGSFKKNKKKTKRTLYPHCTNKLTIPLGFGNDGKHTFREPFGACSGDSGGPLVCPSMTDKPLDWPYLWPQETVVGVVSFGDPTCNKKPSVLSEVSKYREWIEVTIMEDEFEGIKMPDYEWKGKE